jgi:hypothetical protein
VRGGFAAANRHLDAQPILHSLPSLLSPSLPPYLLEGVQPKGLRHGLEEGNLHPCHLGRA